MMERSGSFFLQSVDGIQLALVLVSLVHVSADRGGNGFQQNLAFAVLVGWFWGSTNFALDSAEKAG